MLFTLKLDLLSRGGDKTSVQIHMLFCTHFTGLFFFSKTGNNSLKVRRAHTENLFLLYKVSQIFVSYGIFYVFYIYVYIYILLSDFLI